MSKRSPYWRPFSARTPLGYAVAGHFNTEPGPNYGSLRFTQVDGPLLRPFVSPGLPSFRQAPSIGSALPLGDGLVDLRAVERLDGTPVAFYPLFDADGALVEVVPRTRDSVVAADTPWRPLATLVGQARHAGIEEAVRRQRGVFVFQLVGTANARLVSYPFRLRLVLSCVLRGTGRIFATYTQMRSWSNQYGLDLPTTYAEFDRQLDAATLDAQAAEILRTINGEARTAALGRFSSSGMMIWASERSACAMLDLPAQLQAEAGALNPIAIWDSMAALADHGVIPTREQVLQTLPQAQSGMEGSLPPGFDQAWERWARAYPQAFAHAEEARIAV
ncbi:MAG TPA: hypothetical protein VHB98_24350 [Chloroflexota bacterium]|nr:hypothetical protein [Chloroflexota bacterium]